VQEQDLGAVRAGETAQVSFVAFPGRTFTGVVDFIYPSLMVNTRTGRVRIVLPNPDGLLRESMYATVVINAPARSGASVLVVPDSARHAVAADRLWRRIATRMRQPSLASARTIWRPRKPEPPNIVISLSEGIAVISCGPK